MRKTFKTDIVKQNLCSRNTRKPPKAWRLSALAHYTKLWISLLCFIDSQAQFTSFFFFRSALKQEFFSNISNISVSIIYLFEFIQVFAFLF